MSKLAGNYLNVEGIAQRTGLSVPGIIALLQRGTIPSERFGRQYVVAVKDVVAWEESRVKRWGRLKMHTGASRTAAEKRAVIKKHIAKLKQKLAAINDEENAA